MLDGLIGVTAPALGRKFALYLFPPERNHNTQVVLGIVLVLVGVALVFVTFETEGISSVAAAVTATPLIGCGLLLIRLNENQRKSITEYLNNLAQLRIYSAIELVAGGILFALVTQFG